MSFVTDLKQKFSGWFGLFGNDTTPKNIGIYGPPNSGKTTLSNRIVTDWTDENAMRDEDDDTDAEDAESEAEDETEDETETEDDGEFGSASHIPHETRRAKRKTVSIEQDGKRVDLDIVDTPGVSTQVDYKDFMDYDIEKDEAVERSREATEGIAEAMHWLREDIDGVVYVLDSTRDPFTQVNTMLIGIIESQDIPVLIFANKIDLEDSSVKRIRDAFPQHKVVELSALEGDNMDEAYDSIAEYFG